MRIALLVIVSLLSGPGCGAAVEPESSPRGQAAPMAAVPACTLSVPAAAREATAGCALSGPGTAKALAGSARRARPTRGAAETAARSTQDRPGST